MHVIICAETEKPCTLIQEPPTKGCKNEICQGAIVIDCDNCEYMGYLGYCLYPLKAGCHRANQNNHVRKLAKFKHYMGKLYGGNLEVHNYHLNGEPKPFDSFFEEAENFSENT